MSSVLVKNYTNKSDYDKKEIFRYLGTKETDNYTEKLIDECIKECNSLIKMSVCYTYSDYDNIDEKLCFDGFEAESSDLEKNLFKCERAVIFAATIGMGIDRLISKYSLVSPSKALIFQAIGAERIETLCDMFNEEIRIEEEKNGYKLKSRYSPGYGNLSLSVQKDIFRVLDCEKKNGLTLGENLLMSPSKSVTAFIGIYRE